MLGRLLHRPWVILVLALIIHTTLFFAMQRDLAAADPLWYATWAHKLAFHASELFASHNTYPFVMRLGLTGPIALMYRLFGVSTFATNLPCLLAGLGIVMIAYGAPSTARGKVLGVVFAMLCTPLLVDAHELNPDLPCAAAMAASILFLSRRDRPRGAWWVVGAVVAWFTAFQIKEAAVWCAPVWICAVISDVREHGLRWAARVFAPAVGIGFGLAAGYLVFCALLWGDPLARFRGINDASSTHEWSLVGQPGAAWIARLTWQPALLLYRMFRVMLVSVLVSPWLVQRRDRIWIVATAAIILLYWFGSSTGASYLPLPILRRMMLPAAPGIIVVMALVTDAAIDRVRGVRWRVGAGAVLGLLLLVPHVQSLARNIAETDRPESAAYAALRAEVASTRELVVLVCGDPRCPPISGFHFGFEPPGNLVVVTAAAFATAPLPEHARVRLITHMTRAGGVAKDIARRADALALPQITSHPQIRLYDGGDGARLHDALAGPS